MKGENGSAGVLFQGGENVKTVAFWGKTNQGGLGSLAGQGVGCLDAVVLSG